VCWEGRHALLSDVSPAAVHIARNYTTACDPDAFATALAEVAAAIKPTIAWLYRPAGSDQSSSISATSIPVVGSHCNVLGISPGQMRQAEPSLSSTIWLLSCCLICVADLRVIDPSLGCLSGARKPVLRSDYSSDYLAEGRMR